jgi:hypothetical protein
MELSNTKNYDVAGAAETLQPNAGIKFLLESNEIKADVPITFTESELDDAGVIVKAEKDELDEKKSKTEQVAVLTVTTTSGNEYNANEFSQSKLTTAVSVLGDAETTDWKLADNSWVVVSKEELKEALRLAGEAQTTIWKGE